MIAPHAPGPIIQNPGDAVDLIDHVERFPVHDKEGRLEIRRSPLFTTAICNAHHLQEMLHGRGNDSLKPRAASNAGTERQSRNFIRTGEFDGCFNCKAVQDHVRIQDHEPTAARDALRMLERANSIIPRVESK